MLSRVALPYLDRFVHTLGVTILTRSQSIINRRSPKILSLSKGVVQPLALGVYMRLVLHIHRKCLASKCLPIHTAARHRLCRLLSKMADFQNTAVIIEKDFRGFTFWHSSKAWLDSLFNLSLSVVVVKLWHVLDGLFM
jgi:hypothetical protein